MITVDISYRGNLAGLRALERALRNPLGVHTRIAGNVQLLTQEYVANLPDHATANRLGATPTGHLPEVARRIGRASTAEKATLLIPRKTRLRAAFGGFTITPGAGKKYLTIPDNARTYGKRARDFEGQLHFQMVGGRHKALCFKDGTVAFWLRESVTIKEQRDLLPWDEIPQEAADTASDYFYEISQGGELP